MVGAPLSAILTAALLPVVGYCAVSLLRRPTDPDVDPVPRDVLAWHGLMGVVMVAVLASATTSSWDWAAAGLFVAAVLWSVLRTSAARRVGHFARLFLMSGAMAAMLVPAGSASAAASDGSAHGAGQVHDMAMPAGTGMLLSGTAALVVASAMAVVALTAVVVVWRPASIQVRLFACCEVVMAAAMVVMALAMA